MNLQPSFDSWTTIFLFAAVQGFFVSLVLIIQNARSNKAKLFLALILLLFSITLVEYVLYWTKYLYYFPHFSNISGGFPFLIGPLFYYYFKNVFENYKPGKKDALALVPFIVHIIYLSRYYFRPAEIKQKFMLLPQIPGQTASVQLMPWLQISSMIIYLCIIILSYRALSATNPETKRWFNYLTGLFAFFIISFASYYILILTPFFSIEWDYMISFSMSFFIYFLAWFGYQQPKIFSGFTLAEALRTSKYAHSGLSQESALQILASITDKMQNEKLYRNFELSLEKLAEAVAAPKHHVSQVINEQIGMNFFDYVNSLRVEEAKHILAEVPKKEMNVIQVAYEVGFNNKVSFNNTFKKFTGVTPTEYRRLSKAGT